MKKIMFVFVLLLFLIGCSLGNTPTAQVEEVLSKYQRLDSSVLDGNLYGMNTDLVKKQYSNLSYEVRDEVIDGDSAVVSVSIDVYDYRDMKKGNKKITYAIDFDVMRDNDGRWVVSELSDDIRKKLLGIY